MRALQSLVAAAAGIPEPEDHSRITTRLGLQEVCRSIDLGEFGSSAETPGFLTAIESAVAELRRARVPPERLDAAATSGMERTLAEIYRQAVQSVPDNADDRWRIANRLTEGIVLDPVTVFGFDDFAPPEWALLRGLGRAGDVVVGMPHADRAAFRAREARHAVWRDEADEIVATDAPATSIPRRIARAVFDDGPHTHDAPIRLVGAAGTMGMLRTAFEELLRRPDTPLSRAALVVPRLADLRDRIDRLASDWGVPIRRSSQVRVLEAPLALALSHLLHLGELGPDEPGALDHLLGWLRTPYSAADPDDVDRFEVAMRRGGVAGRGNLMRRWDRKVIEPAIRLARASDDGPRAQLATLLEFGWEALRRVAHDEGRPSTADVRDRLALQALSGLAAAFEPVAEPGPDEGAPRVRGPLPPGELGRLIADLTFVEHAGPADGLDVHDLTSIRGREYDLVVIAGLDGAGVPTAPTPDPLLGGIRGALADELPPRAPGTSEARLRFVHALDAAAQDVVLLRRIVDDEGRELPPSPYWVEAARVAGRDPDLLDRRTGKLGELDDGQTPATEREALRYVALAGGVVSGLLEKAASRRVRNVGLPPGAMDSRTGYRVTELEHFLACPYGWLYANAIAPEEMETTLDPRFEGGFAHEVLERVYKRMKDAGLGPCVTSSLADYRVTLDVAMREVADEWRPSGAGRVFDALVTRIHRHLNGALSREAALESHFVPSAIEELLVDDLLVADIAPGVAIRGRVDRLDISPDRAHSIVVDYKRSGGTFVKGSDNVLKRLQLPLYAVMAKNALDIDAEPVGGLYLGLLQPTLAGAISDGIAGAPQVKPSMIVSPGDWSVFVADAVAATREAVRRIRAGELDPPPEQGCPSYCGCEALWR